MIADRPRLGVLYLRRRPEHYVYEGFRQTLCGYEWPEQLRYRVKVPEPGRPTTFVTCYSCRQQA